jgi:hypothetical protein
MIAMRLADNAPGDSDAESEEHMTLQETDRGWKLTA